MLKYYALIICLFLAFQLGAQTFWETHAAINLIREIEFYENKVYVCHRGGFSIVDQLSGYEQTLLPANSDLRSSGTNQIEILSNGHMWISGYRGGGLFYSTDEEMIHHYFLPNGDTLHTALNLVANDSELWFNLGQDAVLWPHRGELTSFKDGEFINHSHIFPENNQIFCFDTDDRLWVADKQYINLYNGQEILESVKIERDNIQISVLYNYYIDSDERHWISVRDENSDFFILCYENESWDAHEVQDFVYNYFENKQGAITFSMAKTTGTYANHEFQIDSTLSLYPQVSDRWDSPQVFGVDPEGHIWIRAHGDTGDYQLHEITPSAVNSFLKNNSYTISLVNDLHSDCDGNLYSSDSRLVYRMIHFSPLYICSK